MKRILFIIGSIFLAMTGAAGASAQQSAADSPKPPPLVMTTTAFEDGGVIPGKYTLKTAVSPELKWAQVPAGTKSFVLYVHDPDVAMEKSTRDVLHWLVWNIPGAATGLPEGISQGDELSDGSRQVSLRTHGYLGPGAPATGPYHHYIFELYALNTMLDIPAGTPEESAATLAQVMKAINGHIWGKAVLVGRFHK